MIYCKIKGGKVIDRAVFESEMPDDWPYRNRWVPSDDAQIGWGYHKGTFTPPPMLEAPSPAPQPESSPVEKLTAFLAANPDVAALLG